jgi:predicted house-cleaning NTP pyrophosphatase (Maf/HAM1 superfamily)
MLDAAGVPYEAMKPDVDEAELKLGLSSTEEIALRLAEAKATSVPGVCVFGRDRVVSAGGRLFVFPGIR